jgi:hypothetical protein
MLWGSARSGTVKSYTLTLLVEDLQVSKSSSRLGSRSLRSRPTLVRSPASLGRNHTSSWFYICKKPFRTYLLGLHCEVGAVHLAVSPPTWTALEWLHCTCMAVVVRIVHKPLADSISVVSLSFGHLCGPDFSRIREKTELTRIELERGPN